MSIVDLENVVVDRFDVGSGTWGERITTDVPGLSTGPDGVVVVGDQLVIVGHYDPGAIVDLGSGTARALAPSMSGVRFPGMVFGEVVFVGDRWLDLGTGTWHEVDPVPGPVREFPVAVEHDDRAYIWAGDACGPATSCTDLVDPEIGLSWAPPASAVGLPESTTPSSDPTASSTSDASGDRAAQLRAVEAFVQFSRAPSPQSAAQVLFSSVVRIGLGADLLAGLDVSRWGDPAAWTLQLVGRWAGVGPVSTLELLAETEQLTTESPTAPVLRRRHRPGAGSLSHGRP